MEGPEILLNPRRFPVVAFIRLEFEGRKHIEKCVVGAMAVAPV